MVWEHQVFPRSGPGTWPELKCRGEEVVKRIQNLDGFSDIPSR